MNSPLKKPKQSSLSQFYKKLDYHQQSLSNISLTPNTQKSNLQHDSDKFAGKISTSPAHSKISNPALAIQQYAQLDINSNMKLKMHNLYVSHDEAKQVKENLFTQNSFKKFEHQKLQYKQRLQQSGTAELMTKRFDNQYSDFDYNLSVEPEQIKVPQKIFQNSINQFRLTDDDRLQSNFLITPQNSLIKSPQRVKQEEIQNFTPLGYEDSQKQPPTSQIIERVNFQNLTADRNKDIKPQALANNFQESIQMRKKQLLSPQTNKMYNKIPSPKKIANKNAVYSPSPSPNKIKSNYTFHRQQIALGKQQQRQVVSSDDQESQKLLTKIKQLQSQVSELKSHKYQFAINQYRQQTKFELQRRLQKQVDCINGQYGQKEKSFIRQATVQINLVNKSFEQIDKYKKTYAIILNQLRQNKLKIEDEYKEKVEEVKKYSDKLVNEWKRQSNEQIKKIINDSHSKHSTKLTNQTQKGLSSSKQKNGSFKNTF